MNSSPAFREIYLVSLAAYTVFGGLSGPNLRPSLSAARGIAVRIPFLVSVGQSSAAETELRRFVELVFWAIYFTDHAVEWRSFAEGAGKGYSKELRRPISYAARRELAFYMDYALELMEAEPSGLGIKAIENAKQAVKSLNAAIHAGKLAQSGNLRPPHDDISEGALRRFAKTHRLTFSSCSLVLAAYRRARFDSLDAVSRSHFDWLLGSTLRKNVRRGPFGLH